MCGAPCPTKVGGWFKAFRVPFILSIGFWAPFMYSHWFIAVTSWTAQGYAAWNYPGASAIALVLVAGFDALAKRLRLGIAAGVSLRVGMALVASACVVVTSFRVFEGVLPNAALMVAGAFAMFVLQVSWWKRYALIESGDYALSLCMGIVLLGILKIGMALSGDGFVAVIGVLPFICAVDVDGLHGKPFHEGEPWFAPRVLGSLGRLAVGVLAFLVIWSVLNAYLKAVAGHQGFGSTASPFLTVLIQTIDICFALAMAWWIAVRKGGIEYVSLWKVSYVLLCLSVAFLAMAGPIQATQVFSTAAFAIAQMLIDLACGNIAHHSRLRPILVFGAGELAYCITDWLARAVMGTAGGALVSVNLLVGLLFCAVLVLAFFLPNRTMGSQYLLSDLNSCPPRAHGQSDVDTRCAELAREHGLSERETQIMALVCTGRSKPYIAEALYLSENTVGTYMRRLYKKLGIHSKQELIDLVVPSR